MLLRKMLRDMRLNKVQFISIFLMSLLGVFVYAGINGEWYGMQTEIDKYYNETKFADFWLVGGNFSSSDLASAQKIPGVSAVQRRLTIDGTADLAASPVLRINIVDENKISTPYLIKGEGFDTSKDGLWLDASFAKAHGLKIDDKITVYVSGLKIEKTILGMVINPEYVYEAKDDSVFTPDAKSFGFAFIPRQAISAAAVLPYNELMVKLNNTSNAAVVKAKLETALSGRYSLILTRDTQPSAAMFKNEIAQNKAMGGIFPVVFFLIAALTMLTTMTRITSGQRTQIGTLKALGFSKRKIIFHYVSYGLWLGLAGGLIGLITGPLVIPPILFAMQKTIYTLPEWQSAISVSDVLALAVSILCCGLSSYFACRKELGEVPAATLRPRIPKIGKHTGIEKSRIWHSFGFSTQWNLRDLMRNRIRSAMAVIGVIGCITLLLWGLGLRDSMNYVTNWMYKDLYTYAAKINLNSNVSGSELAALQSKYHGQLIQETNIELKTGAVEKSGDLAVVGPGSMYNFEDSAMKSISLPVSGIGMSYKMASLLNVRIGDTVRWRIYGEKTWKDATIHTIYRTPIGQGIAITQSAYETMGNKLLPTALLVAGNAQGASILPGVENVQNKEALMNSFNSMLNSMQTIIAILILAAVILGFVVLYNLGALSLTERTRELATLKVLGFPNKKIQLLLQKQNIWLTVLGILLGIPAGYIFIGYMLSTISDSSDYITHVSLQTLTICIVSTFLLSLTVNFIMSRKVKTIDMVSSLKSVE